MAGKQRAAAVVHVWDERPLTLDRLPPRPECGPHLSGVSVFFTGWGNRQRSNLSSGIFLTLVAASRGRQTSHSGGALWKRSSLLWGNRAQVSGRVGTLSVKDRLQPSPRDATATHESNRDTLYRIWRLVLLQAGQTAG